MAPQHNQAPACVGVVQVRAEAAAEAPAEPKVWTPPTLNPATPSPIFGGSTGARRDWGACGAVEEAAAPSWRQR